MNRWMLSRRLLWGTVAVAALGLAALAWRANTVEARTEPAAETAAPAQNYEMFGQGLAEATLVDQTGAEVRWGDLNGPPRALFFGFTRCPEICPTTLADLDNALDQIGPDAARLRIDFVTIDPARDTPETLAAYLGSFAGRDIRGYTGSDAQIAQIANAYRAAYRREELDGGDYTMNHTTMVYLIDSDGRVVDLLSYGAPPDRVVAQLSALLARQS